MNKRLEEYIQKVLGHVQEKYPDKSVKLFYNDYGETEPGKVKCISALADAVKAGGGRIDGIGMQAHYSMEYPSADEFYNAIKEYSWHVNEVQVTELDKILQAIDEGVNITELAFWGVADDDSWLVEPEFSQNRNNMLLLFDENLKAKPAFWAITGASKPGKP